MLIHSLKEIYQKQQFLPSWFGVVINPFYIARYNLASGIKDFSDYMRGELLDVGCGTKPYKSVFTVDSYIGLDIDSDLTRKRETADYFYDGKEFPFQDKSFDSVLCNQVLEHVFNPREFLSEINRVLKPGGKLLLTVPFVWDEHEQPFDYARYSSFGLRSLLEKNGFIVLEQKKLGADVGVIFQLINAYLYKIVAKWPRLLHFLFTVSVMAVINILAVLFKLFMPKNSDLYLDNIILVEKKL